MNELDKRQLYINILEDVIRWMISEGEVSAKQVADRLLYHDERASGLVCIYEDRDPTDYQVPPLNQLNEFAIKLLQQERQA